MSDVYAEIKEHFADMEGVTVNSGRGSQGLKLGGKMFAMFYTGELVVQLAPERVGEIVASGEGKGFDPGAGKPMADRALIPASGKDNSVAFREESRRYADSRS